MTVVIRVDRTVDLYVVWCPTRRMPLTHGDRDQVAAWLAADACRHAFTVPRPFIEQQVAARLERAARNGSSADPAWGFGGWPHEALPYGDGLLPRDRLAQACYLIADGRSREVEYLLICVDRSLT